MGILKVSVEALSEELSAKLPTHGFSSECEFDREGHFRRQWHSHCTWKRNTVELVYKRGSTFPPYVNFIVSFPIMNDSQDFEHFAGTGVILPRFPIFYPQKRISKWASKSWSKISMELPWFERFETIEKCFCQIDDYANRNGPVRGPAVEYIRNLKIEQVAHGDAEESV